MLATTGAHGLDDSGGASQPIFDEEIPALGACKTSVPVLTEEQEDAGGSSFVVITVLLKFGR